MYLGIGYWEIAALLKSISQSPNLYSRNMQERYIQLAHGNVFTKTAGNPADPLVLGIHGWSQQNGWHTWEPILVPLGAAGYYAVGVDMPGWGQSVSMNQRGLGFSEAIGVVVGLMDALGKKTAVLLGKSWGGGIAIGTALAHPERITKLILTAPAFRKPELLPGVTQPVLMAWSTDDTTIPYEVADAYMQHVANIQLETYATGGHNAAPNNAADFAPKAIEFLGE